MSQSIPEIVKELKESSRIEAVKRGVCYEERSIL